VFNDENLIKYEYQSNADANKSSIYLHIYIFFGMQKLNFRYQITMWLSVF